jgi:hypothetical protein
VGHASDCGLPRIFLAQTAQATLLLISIPPGVISAKANASHSPGVFGQRIWYRTPIWKTTDGLVLRPMGKPKGKTARTRTHAETHIDEAAFGRPPPLWGGRLLVSPCVWESCSVRLSRGLTRQSGLSGPCTHTP